MFIECLQIVISEAYSFIYKTKIAKENLADLKIYINHNNVVVFFFFAYIFIYKNELIWNLNLLRYLKLSWNRKISQYSIRLIKNKKEKKLNSGNKNISYYYNFKKFSRIHFEEE